MNKYHSTFHFIKAFSNFMVDIELILKKYGYMNLLKKGFYFLLAPIFIFIDSVFSNTEVPERTSDGFLKETEEDIGISEADLYSMEPHHTVHIANLYNEVCNK